MDTAFLISEGKERKQHFKILTRNSFHVQYDAHEGCATLPHVQLNYHKYVCKLDFFLSFAVDLKNRDIVVSVVALHCTVCAFLCFNMSCCFKVQSAFQIPFTGR